MASASSASALTARKSRRTRPGKQKAFNQVFALGTRVPRFRNMSLGQQVMRFTRDGTLNDIVSSTIGEVDGSANFTLSALNGSTDFTTLFDQYRIDMIEIWFSPASNTITIANADAALFRTVVDLDDSATATFLALGEYETEQTASGISGQYWRFQPGAALAAYSGAFTSYANVLSPWIDVASTGVQHYGIKYAWQQTAGGVYIMHAYYRVHLSARAVR